MVNWVFYIMIFFVKCDPIENVVGAQFCFYPSTKINGILKLIKND